MKPLTHLLPFQLPWLKGQVEVGSLSAIGALTRTCVARLAAIEGLQTAAGSKSGSNLVELDFPALSPAELIPTQ